MGKLNPTRFATLLPRLMMLAFLTASVALPRAVAQRKTAGVPYDSIATDGENYAGPARGSEWSQTRSTITIGLLAPMHGPERADGEALVAAANMALKDSTKRPLAGGRHIELVIGDQSGPAWGHVSDEILQMVLQKNVLAIITSTDGTTTHVSEQVGNRIGVPILTLSSDATTTQIDIPWIFRIGPSDAEQAQAIAANIYRERGLKNVLVISENDHDGRVGAAAMRQAAASLGVPIPEELVLDSQHPDFSSVTTRFRNDPAQAIVLWTRSDVAQRLLALLRANDIHIPFYLSQQAAQSASGLTLAAAADEEERVAAPPAAWTIAGQEEATAMRKSFVARYLQQTGRTPSDTAAEAYDAVCLTVRALRAAGPNRARVRDHLAQTGEYSGASGMISFDREGDNASQVDMVALRPESDSTRMGGMAK